MTGSLRARLAAIVLFFASSTGLVLSASADVFLYDGEIFFCSSTCDSFGALGGAAGGSTNTTNSVVVGSIDIPVQGDGSFSFAATDNVPFNFTITTSAIPLEPPVINPGPGGGCPPPDVPGQLCNATSVNPLPLSGEVATVEGSGVVGADGNFVSGSIIFTFTAAPFSNNGAVVTFNVADSTGIGTVFGGVVTFTEIQGSTGANGGFTPAPPVLAVSMPDPDPFPDTLLGDTETATVTVTNTGEGQGIVTLGTASLMAPFAIAADGCTGTPLVPLTGSCTIDVSFAPTTEGAAMGSFTVESANNDPASIEVMLVGNAIVPEIEVMPNPLEFPDVLIGDSEALDVTVTNTGSAALDIPAMGVTALTAPYAITTDGCSGTSVAPAGTCTITVTFTPTVAGAAGTSFDISSNDPNEATVTVAVTGAGAEADIAVAPMNLVFPSILTGETQVRTVTVTNDGTADLVIGMIDGASIVAPFALNGDTCSSMTLAPMATCELMIEFAPVAAGDFTNSYDIPSNDGDEPVVTAMLTGTATAAPEPFITVDPSELALGEVIVSAMNMGTISIINDGSADLTIGAVAIGGTNAAEFSQTSQCGTLAPDAGCTITVAFAPADVGDREAELTIESDGANETLSTVALTGVGVLGPQIVLSIPSTTEASLTFGSGTDPVEIDQSATASLMVVSSGSIDAVVSGVALSGPGAAEFTIDSETCTQAPLAPMSTCNVQITFSPVTAGDKTATITVTSNDVDEPMQTAPLVGFVLVGSRPEFSVPEIEVGSSTDPVTVGQSGTSAFDITNTGTDPLLVVSVMLGGMDAADFSVTEDCTAAPVDRNGTCDIAVTFSPTTPGTKNAELTIVTDSVVTRQLSRGNSQVTTIIPIQATAAARPAPPPAPPGSQTNVPPIFATSDVDSDGGCFIATAAFGSYLDPNVQVLRDFRDDVLLTNGAGRKAVQFYYANSPMLADYIARHEGARTATRYALTPVVYAVAYPIPALMIFSALWYGLRRRRAVRAR
ncbi:MAG: choice-of-anchor D domain-containing protein [Gammaproteobacteria bacterium]